MTVEAPHQTVMVELVTTRGGRSQRVEAEWFGIGAELGESPVWVAEQEAIASLDITGQDLHLLRPGSGAHEIVPLSGTAHAAMLGDGSAIVFAADRLLHEYALEKQTIRPMKGRPGGPPAGTTFSDGKVDRAGRIWIGARRPDGSVGGGSLLSWETGQRPIVRVAGLTGPNGLTWNAAGDRLYHADSRLRLIHRYRFDQRDGSVSNGGVFVSWSEREGRPDGMTVDTDDHVWCAAWDGGCIRRYDPLGRLVQTLSLPAIRPTSCAFGGPRLDRLWVTTARPPSIAPGDMGGGLFSVDVGRIGFTPVPASTRI
jgi:sugar lactone lactonase YvrE